MFGLVCLCSMCEGSRIYWPDHSVYFVAWSLVFVYSSFTNSPFLACCGYLPFSFSLQPLFLLPIVGFLLYVQPIHSRLFQSLESLGVALRPLHYAFSIRFFFPLLFFSFCFICFWAFICPWVIYRCLIFLLLTSNQTRTLWKPSRGYSVDLLCVWCLFVYCGMVWFVLFYYSSPSPFTILLILVLSYPFLEGARCGRALLSTRHLHL